MLAFKELYYFIFWPQDSSSYLSFPTEALLVGVDAAIPAADCPGLYALTLPTLIFCSRSKRDSRLLNGGGERGGELEIQTRKTDLNWLTLA